MLARAQEKRTSLPQHFSKILINFVCPFLLQICHQCVNELVQVSSGNIRAEDAGSILRTTNLKKEPTSEIRGE